MAEKMTELLHCMWRTEFKVAFTVHLYERKGNPQVCDNRSGISLLAISGKILAKSLLNHLNRFYIDRDQTGLNPESQCGFVSEKTEGIFTARKHEEK